MILDLTLKLDEELKKKMAVQADFDPSQEVKDRTGQVMRDFQIANTIRNKPYPEFNFQSLQNRFTLDQTSWNQYPGEASKDPLEAWKSLAFRPIVRNKIISIAAHITGTTIIPQFYAQNEEDEEDQDAAEVMRDLVTWALDNSKFTRTFLYTVIAALVNPAAFIHLEYRQIYRKIKKIKEDGSWEIETVLDDMKSGFINTMVPIDELWISNFYVHEIQQQPFLIWRRALDFTTAQEKYGDLENFKYVKPGLQYLYTNQYNLFYQMYDVSLSGELVEEVIYYNRLQDLELRFVNGILMDDVDRPIQRQDKNYPFVKGGYELFDDGRCFYYKSAAFKMSDDENVVNTAYRMLIDGTYLQIMPPAVVFGGEEIGSSVIAPGAVTVVDNTANPNASFQTIGTNNNLQSAYNLLEKVEGSITESSTENLGEYPDKSTTAYATSVVAQQAKTLLGLFGKMISFMVEDYGNLLKSDIIQYMTVGEVSDLMSPSQMLKFRKFLIPDQTIDGKKKTKKIEFDMNLPDQGTPADFMSVSTKIAQKQRDLGDNVAIAKVNPALFRSLKFKCVCKPEAVEPKSDALMSALNLEEYDRAIANPIIAQNPDNLEAVTRDLLFGSYAKTKDNTDKYLQPMQQPAQQPQPGQPQTNIQGPAQQNPMSLNMGNQPASLKSVAKAL